MLGISFFPLQMREKAPEIWVGPSYLESSALSLNTAIQVGRAQAATREDQPVPQWHHGPSTSHIPSSAG